MMFKKLYILMLCFIMLTFCGCSNNNGRIENETKTQSQTNSSQSSSTEPSQTPSEASEDTSSKVSSKVSSESSVISKSPTKSSSKASSSTVSEPPKVRESGEHTNPLNGLKELSKAQTLMRPYAVMINNINVAQPVQSGLAKAEIVYETEVEGGITRLMAVFKDPTGISQIGTVRSARYPYVDLALGHNAIYFHCGKDPTYCKPHLDDIDNIDFNSGTYSKYSKRITNGLKREHTLYTSGDSLIAAAKKHKYSTTLSKTDPWVHFADEPIISGENDCNTVTVKFSDSYKSTFKYNDKSGLYTRYSNNNLLKDYFTQEVKTVTNVFVLLTDITFYPDNYHKKVDLTGGDGFYISYGKYVQIKWSKGKATNGFEFTDISGNELIVNPGQSWICISDRIRSAPSFS